VLGLASPGSAVAATDVLVQPANPNSPFPTNKSAEAAIAINAESPNMVAAAAFDEVDEAPCGTAFATPAAPCPFIPGVGTTGVYFSYDRGHSWTQPTFSGLTAANGTVHVGPIHTLPWYFEAGLQSDGDVGVAFGPQPLHGHFSWSNGARAYFSNLVSGPSLKGFEAVGVSRIDDPTPDRIGVKRNWFRPVVVPSHISTTAFEDKSQIWADNAASSPFFGNVYLCFAEFRSNGSAPSPLKVAVSRDGGDTWRVRQVTAAANNPHSALGFGTSGCTIRTDSHGVVYVFALNFAFGTPGHPYHVVVKSYDGGARWTRPRRLFQINDACFRVDPVQQRCVSDGYAGARIDLAPAPSVDIANGAPTGADATNEIVDSWMDGRFGLNHEAIMFSYSTDGAATFSTPTVVPGPGRGFYSAPAISPDGTRVYLANSWLLAPFQATTANPRPLLNTFDTSLIGADGAPSGWTRAVTGTPGDARAGSANGLSSEFLGDYNYASAARDYGVGVWTADARDATHCAAIDAWRQTLIDILSGAGGSIPLPPNPASACPGTFGNINIYAATTG
jgi:hypothetical protein